VGLKDVIKKGVFVDILRGMSVTGTYFVVDKVTVEYPKEKLQPYPRFRGAQALLSDPDTGDTKCVACMLCPTICPSQCIHVVGEQTPDGRSHPATFEIDLSRCIFCGLCEEVCPVAAIVMTRRYELSTFDKSDLLLDKAWLMANAVNVHKESFAVEAPDGGAPAGSEPQAAVTAASGETGAADAGGAVSPPEAAAAEDGGKR
jgi:NADH-quinone oxidoreductase subunit I